MLIDGIRGEETEEAAALSAGALFMQGVATSIDALSVGFTIAEYGWLMALAASGIIAVVTFFLRHGGPAHQAKVRHKALRQMPLCWAVSSSSALGWRSSSPACSSEKWAKKTGTASGRRCAGLFPVEHF